MKRYKHLLIIPAIASLFLVALPSGAIAGCKINYSFLNHSNTDIASFDKFQVKSKGGTWRNIQPQTTRILKRNISPKTGKVKFNLVKRKYPKFLNPGEKLEGDFTGTFNCNAKRKYRIEVREGNCKKHVYYPSANNWTTSVNVNFGDISRHCN